MAFRLNISWNPGEKFDFGNSLNISLLSAVDMTLTLTEESLRSGFNYFDSGNSGQKFETCQ